MMRKGRAIKFWFALILVSASLTGIPRSLAEGDRHQPFSEIIIAINNNSQELTSSLEELKTARNEFKSARERFFADMDKAAINPYLQASADSKIVNGKLLKLRQASTSFRQNIEASDSQTSREFENIFARMDGAITDISIITNLLQKGLADRWAVKEVQTLLDSSSVDGLFGPTTQRQIESFLSDRAEQLEINIEELEEIIERAGFAETQEKLTEKVAGIEEQNKELREKLETVSQQTVPYASEQQVAQLASKHQQLQQKFSQLAKEYANGRDRWRWNFVAIALIGLVVMGAIALLARWYAKLNQATVNKTEKRIQELSQKADEASVNTQKIQGLEARFFARESFVNSDFINAIGDEMLPPEEKENVILNNALMELIEKEKTISRSIDLQPALYLVLQKLNIFALTVRYNEDPGSLSKQATAVSETSKSMSDRNCSGSEKVIFEKSNKGDYWLLKEGDYYFLIPKAEFRLNQFNYDSLKTYFNCEEYQPEGPKEFKLLKPATLSTKLEGKQWQLEEKGILEFKAREENDEI